MTILCLPRLYFLYVDGRLTLTFQVIHTEQDDQEVERKRRSVKEALVEMKQREKEVKEFHEREQQLREEEAMQRKEEMEQQLKNKILASNR